MLLAMALGGELATASPNESLVGTSAGHYRGVIDASGVRSFRGIRYAESPAGANRWQPPRRAEKLSGATSAMDYGPACLQPKRSAATA